MNNLPLRLARGAEKELTIVGLPYLLSIIVTILWPNWITFILAIALTPIFALLLYFFRDPKRFPPAGDGLVAPADGEIVAIEIVDEPHFLQGKALRISTFMSILNVHVNRAPLEGQVVMTKHVPGQFLQAFRPESAEVNEHNLIGLETVHGHVLVKQISGILARRIVCWVSPGQQLKRGQRLGVIKFGSRVDLFLPPEAVAAVQIGDHVHAGLTIIAQWKGTEPSVTLDT